MQHLIANRWFSREMLFVFCLHLISVLTPLPFDWVFIFITPVYYPSSILFDRGLKCQSNHLKGRCRCSDVRVTRLSCFDWDIFMDVEKHHVPLYQKIVFPKYYMFLLKLFGLL